MTESKTHSAPFSIREGLELVRQGVLEDMPQGDLTTRSLGLTSRPGTARLIAKQDLVVSGLDLFQATVLSLDPDCRVQWTFVDGQSVLKGQVVGLLHGNLIEILKAERTALNFLGHLSGIATLTRQYVAQVEHTSTQILDTRKTLPGYRALEKKAVRDGGGRNHRLNLSDAILIKENHIRAVGGLSAAIQAVRRHTSASIEIETTTLNEVREAIDGKVQRILLDNMSNELMAEALELIPAEIQTEASGNMSLSRVRSVAELGVNFISVGALTHSAPVADLSLIFDWG